MKRTLFVITMLAALLAASSVLIADDTLSTVPGSPDSPQLNSIDTGVALTPAEEEQIKASGDMRFATQRQDIDMSAATILPTVEPTPEMREDLAEIELPVLLPASLQSHLDEAYLFAETDRYSISLSYDGVNIVIEGSRLAMVHPNIKAGSMDSLRNEEGAIISRTHGIVSASFNRFGAAYIIDVECAQPFNDARCTADSYVNGLISDLGLMGGAR